MFARVVGAVAVVEFHEHAVQMHGMGERGLIHEADPHAFAFAGANGLPHAERTAIDRPIIAVHLPGKSHHVNLRTENRFDGVNYQAVFEAPAHIWTQLSLPLTDFQPSFRGRRVPDAPPFDPARLQQIGLMIADRQAGPFALAIRSISFE